MYYYHFGDSHVVGASPEILVRQESTPEGQKVTIRPLAGTRPRGATPALDKATEVELVNDPKERAEHVMLIDLARNDIGRIAKTGSVKVTEAFAVERYSHVMHIVSNVEGILNDGMTSMDVLKATFPAGTLTGAPKVHAMELIDQLEPTKRGLYGGACGYPSYAGDMDLAIAIRTGIVRTEPSMCRLRPVSWPTRCPRWSGRNRTQGPRPAARRRTRGRGSGMTRAIDNTALQHDGKTCAAISTRSTMCWCPAGHARRLHDPGRAHQAGCGAGAR